MKIAKINKKITGIDYTKSVNENIFLLIGCKQIEILGKHQYRYENVIFIKRKYLERFISTKINSYKWAMQ